MNTRLSKKEYYLQMLSLVSARSTCIRRSVGAIITDKGGHVLSTGYNGPPQGFDHCIITPCAGAKDQSGDNTRCMATHAEQNALLQCSSLDRAHTMYVSASPCFACAKMICNTNIEEIICAEQYSDKQGLDVLLHCGIKVEIAGKVVTQDLS